MKKIYKTPTMKTAVISVESILAGSNVDVYGNANSNLNVLSKRNGNWEDEDEDF